MEKKLKFRTPVLLIIFLFVFVSCASIKQREYYVPEEPAEAVSDDVVRIVQISDLHSNDYGKNQEKLVKKIQESHPDIVVFTGDIFEYKFKPEKTVNNVEHVLKAVSEICPFYYISGNHEYYYQHNNEYVYLIKDYGGTILENEVAVVQIKGMTIAIGGVSDPIASIPAEQRKKDGADNEVYLSNLKDVAEKASKIESDLKILLAHRPEYIEDYVSFGVFDLILSGHAHGGQWRFAFINGIYAPTQGLFPKYAGGRYDFNDNNKPSVFIVSRGLSYQEPYLPRFFNPVELVEILVQTEAFRK